MRAPARASIIAAIASASSLGCTSGGDTADDTSFVQRDSAGIAIAESGRPLWGREDGWHLAGQPEWTIGQEGPGAGHDDSPALSDVIDVRAVAGGRVVFGNRGWKQVLVVDSLGHLQRSLGREGEGPGEFRSFSGVFPCTGDRIGVLHAGALDVFHLVRGFVRRFTAHTGLVPDTRDVASDCRRMLSRGEARFPPPGQEGVLRLPLLWTDTAFQVLDTVVVDSFPGALTGQVSGAPPFPRFAPWSVFDPQYAVADTLVIHGLGTRPEIRWLLPDGRVTRIVRWNAVPVPVTDADRELWAEKRRRALARFGDNEDTRMGFPSLDEWREVPEVKPFFATSGDAIRVADDGHVWLRENPGTIEYYERYPPEEAIPPERWIVFDPSGRWLGSVAMPEGFHLHAVARGRAFGVHRDALDVETVRAYLILGY